MSIVRLRTSTQPANLEKASNIYGRDVLADYPLANEVRLLSLTEVVVSR
jgi:hypothetical protein